MAPRDRRPAPAPPPDDGEGHTQMLNVGSDAEHEERTDPAARAPPSDDEPGATQMLKVDAPAEPPPRRRAPPRVDPEPAPEPEPEEAPAPRPQASRRAPPAAAAAPARRAAAPAPLPKDDGATQMLDLRHVPTADELRQQAVKKAALSNLPARRKKMPEEIEVPVEHLHEAIHEKAHEEQHGAHGHAHGHAAHAGFNMQVALSSALIAVLAAVSALMSGHYANEAMIEQIRGSDQWAFFQAKSIKSAVLQAKADTLSGMGKTTTAGDDAKIAQYAQEQKDISKKAKVLEEESHHHLNIHQVLARTVTLFQIAIALSAIAVLTRKRPLWYMSLAGGALGLIIMVQALVFTH